jgi:hypothetical protein
MEPHRYKLGQRVKFFQQPVTLSPRKANPEGPSDSYEVTRLLPSNGAEFQYRIKNNSGQERVVLESEIG